MLPRRLPLLVALFVLGACSDPDKGDSAGDSASGTSTTDPTTTAGTTGATTEPTTGGPQPAECEQDSDCVLINNCCECNARPASEPVPPCEGNCFQPTCDALSLGGITVACRSGVCEFANVQCSEGPPACDSPMPGCPEGTRISIVGDCWGPCVPPRLCEGEPCTEGSCGDGWMCVEHQATASICAPIPNECGGTPSCACAGPYLDEFCAASCADADGELLCQDGG
jgi:hypothetical protein